MTDVTSLSSGQLAALVKARLTDGEVCIDQNLVCSATERTDLRAGFAEAEDAVNELVRRADR